MHMNVALYPECMYLRATSTISSHCIVHCNIYNAVQNVEGRDIN